MSGVHLMYDLGVSNCIHAFGPAWFWTQVAIAVLIQTLWRHGEHRSNCAIRTVKMAWRAPPPCDCGLDGVLLRAILSDDGS